MPLQIKAEPSLKDVLSDSERPLVGMWVCSGNPLVAEICAGAGLDWLLIDGEHSPNGLESILAQLQAIHGYPVTAVVRPPVNDATIIKQYLDLGVQTLLIPMVNTADDAVAAVAAAHYPPRGVRGVGSALARSARWNRIPEYLATASETITVVVQLETAEAVANAEEILAVDGVDAVFIGPSDLAASMGVIGQQQHPDVLAAVKRCIRAAQIAGKPVGVNAFVESTAKRYLDLGVNFILVGADVTLLARGSEDLAAKFIPRDEPSAG